VHTPIVAALIPTLCWNHGGDEIEQALRAAVLLAVIRVTQGWPRRTAIEILIDCLAWIRAEQRFIGPYPQRRSSPS
jgi:hypothetical protein